MMLREMRQGALGHRCCPEVSRANAAMALVSKPETAGGQCRVGSRPAGSGSPRGCSQPSAFSTSQEDVSDEPFPCPGLSTMKFEPLVLFPSAVSNNKKSSHFGGADSVPGTVLGASRALPP